MNLTSDEPWHATQPSWLESREACGEAAASWAPPNVQNAIAGTMHAKMNLAIRHRMRPENPHRRTCIDST